MTRHVLSERRSGSLKAIPRRSAPWVRWLLSAAPMAFTLAVLAILLPLGVRTTTGAAFALAVAAVLVMLVAAGIETTAVVLIAVGFVLAPMNDVRPIASLDFVTASDACLVVGIALLVPVLIGRRFQPPTLFVVGALGVIAAGLVSSVVNPDPFTSLNSMMRLVVGALALPVFFVMWRPRREVVVILAAAYVVGDVINVAFALFNGVASYENRYLGLTTHPNILGICELLGLALIPFLLHELPKSFRWMVLTAAAICAYGIWISGSRAALLVAVVVAVLYPMLARSIEAFLILFGLAIVPVYLVGRTLTSGEVGNNILGRLGGGGSAAASDQVREALIVETTDKFLSHPILGVGFARVLEAHNIYLAIAAAGGVVVLVFYLILLSSVVLHPFTIGPSYRLLALPALAYALIGPLTPLLWDRYIWCLLALPFLVPLFEKSSAADTSTSSK